MKLDSKDIALLAKLQIDAQTPTQQLADTLAMSASQIGRRRQRLESEGLILRTPARLNAKLLGLDVQAFMQIQTQSQTEEAHIAVARLVKTRADIVAAWTLTGEADYLFRVYCRDLPALNRLVQNVLLPHPAIGRVHSQIVMDDIKDDTALPLPGAG
ncbi:MAG: Lrp/AsnC family transcriptional regulator [Pseudomonadota bacterium]